MGMAYAALGLNGEAGEAAEVVKKTWRDTGTLTPELREKLIKEMGDVLWYLAALSDEININFGEVAQRNVDKLLSRFERDVIHGAGDDR